MQPAIEWRPRRFSEEDESAFKAQMGARVLPLLRLANVIGIFAFAGYAAWDLLLASDALTRTGPIRLTVICLFLTALALTYLPAVRRSPLLIGLLTGGVYAFVAIGFTLVLAELPGGFAAGLSGFLLGMIFIPLITVGYVQACFALMPLVGLPLALMAYLGASDFDLINSAAWLFGAVGFVVGFAYLLEILNRRAFHLERMLDAEKERSEALLLNILPAAIAERLKAEEEPLADQCDSATVLFADLVGFTALSRQMPAAEVVTLLNDLFSRFDALVARHGAEKIKTIGDAYMVAAGLTDGKADHVARVAQLALDMRSAFGAFRRDHGLDVKLRIGVHSGAVVAGVIGKQKFAYDLWGDTVNIASRMESEGVPDEIQISAETKALLGGDFGAEPRGEIAIKGHRPRPAFLLKGAASV